MGEEKKHCSDGEKGKAVTCHLRRQLWLFLRTLKANQQDFRQIFFHPARKSIPKHTYRKAMKDSGNHIRILPLVIHGSWEVHVGIATEDKEYVPPPFICFQTLFWPYMKRCSLSCVREPCTNACNTVFPFCYSYSFVITAPVTAIIFLVWWGAFMYVAISTTGTALTAYAVRICVLRFRLSALFYVRRVLFPTEIKNAANRLFPLFSGA